MSRGQVAARVSRGATESIGHERLLHVVATSGAGGTGGAGVVLFNVVGWI